MSLTRELDGLLNTLGNAIESVLGEQGGARGVVASPARADSGRTLSREANGGDAIDRILAAPDRVTAVASLRESEVINAFRDELSDGLIRVDTANRLLGLVSQIVSRLL